MELRGTEYAAGSVVVWLRRGQSGGLKSLDIGISWERHEAARFEDMERQDANSRPRSNHSRTVYVRQTGTSIPDQRKAVDDDEPERHTACKGVVFADRPSKRLERVKEGGSDMIR